MLSPQDYTCHRFSYPRKNNPSAAVLQFGPVVARQAHWLENPSSFPKSVQPNSLTHTLSPNLSPQESSNSGGRRPATHQIVAVGCAPKSLASSNLSSSP